uniref:Uncharacterized protein n=1 Tax=Anguilla anguilla TaxID=7936 RepID=A0A0E9X2A0_ANGAN
MYILIHSKTSIYKLKKFFTNRHCQFIHAFRKGSNTMAIALKPMPSPLGCLLNCLWILKFCEVSYRAHITLFIKDKGS